MGFVGGRGDVGELYVGEIFDFFVDDGNVVFVGGVEFEDVGFY